MLFSACTAEQALVYLPLSLVLTMAVPSFQEMFFPFLQLLADAKPHRMQEMPEYVANHFKLSPEDREELIPSGQSSKLANRIGWCRTHLKFAGLIEKITWGEYQITPAGMQVVQNPPEKLDLKFLDTIPAHRDWFHAEKSTGTTTTIEVPSTEVTPQERLGALISDLRAQLAAEVHVSLKDCNPYRFEQIVVDLLLAMGYGGSRAEAGSVTKRSGDEGIDGIINEDRLGLDVIYVQAKRWQGTVGRKEIQSFVGALAGKQAHKGIFITTSDYTREALDYARGLPQKIILIDGQRLAELMIEQNVGVSVAETYQVKRLDADYFADV